MNKLTIRCDHDQFMIIYGLLIVELARLENESDKDIYIISQVRSIIEEMESINKG